MMAACEAGDVFGLLEGGTGGAREAADALLPLFGAVREPWLTQGLLQYHARTGSTRALELLARANDLHARFLLDALRDQLRSDRAARHHALSALLPIVARRPPWLHHLPSHPVARDVLRWARLERDAVPLVHALLALATLLPAAPALASACAGELADALMRPSALEPPPAPPLRAHLHLAQLALFRALYATHPCTLLEALRAHGAELPAGAARSAWERAFTSLAHSVRLHPALVTGSRLREADAVRWSRFEVHDAVAEGRRLSLPAREEAPSPLPAPAAAAASRSPAPAAGSGAQAVRAASALRPGAEPWFPLGDRCGGDSAPPTPLPADMDISEPPEAAVEATPENTPAREPRAQFRFPAESGAVRAIGRRSRPPSPPRSEMSPAGDAYTSRLQRVALERNAADSPVAFGGTPPPAGAPVARPEPSRPAAAADAEPLNVEDREVLELTRRALGESEWPEAEAGGGWKALDPRRRGAAEGGRPRPGAAARPARRSASCSPSLGGARSHSVAVQTVDTWPAPYEFIVADFYRQLPEETSVQTGDAGLPCERLEAYLDELYAGGAAAKGQQADLSEQLALVHAQLMYERWRREAHAERNRRLLGRCRQVRALELRNAALEDLLRAARRERDEAHLRLEQERRGPQPPPPPPPGDREARLEAALDKERAARLRAEAALHESEVQRALDAAELQRTRGDSFEAARHVEALARAALSADRRAEHVRRLRRELAVLAEREARLEEAVRAGLHSGGAADASLDPGLEKALRATCARAEAEAEASTARADLATARLHELEAQMSARDETIAQLKRAMRMAAEEGAAKLRALHDKYESLMRIVRATEARRLEWLAERPHQPQHPPAAPADGQALASN